MKMKRALAKQICEEMHEVGGRTRGFIGEFLDAHVIIGLRPMGDGGHCPVFIEVGGDEPGLRRKLEDAIMLKAVEIMARRNAEDR